MTVNDWLAILLPGVSLDEGAVSALSSQCERLYDLEPQQVTVMTSSA